MNITLDKPPPPVSRGPRPPLDKPPPPMSRTFRPPPQPEVVTISGRVHHVHSGTIHSVVREQYCTCAPRTKMEMVMLIMIVVMGFVIVGLIAAVSAVAKANCDPKKWETFHELLSLN